LKRTLLILTLWMKFYRKLHPIFLTRVTWRPWAPRHKGYGLIAGEARGSSFPYLGGRDLPHLRLERNSIFLFKLLRNTERWPEWSADWRCTFGEDRQPSENHEWGHARECRRLSAKSGSSVWYSDRRGSTFKFFGVQEPQSPHSRQEPADLPVPRKEDPAVQRKTEGGCKPWPGQPGRSDPRQ